MKPGVTVITPTGDRPEALGLLVKYMERQTVKPDQWIVIDDGDMPASLYQDGVSSLWSNKVYIRRAKNKREPKHTLPLNLLEAWPLVEYDTILTMEDDDWYHPQYIEWMMSRFAVTGRMLIGQGHAVYYHLPSRRYKIGLNAYHASMCQTGIKSSILYKAINATKEALNRNTPFVDLKLWLNVKKDDKQVLLDDVTYCVGLKGMPGRQGKCAGWTKYKTKSFVTDYDGSFLRSLIGQDTELYKKILWKESYNNGQVGSTMY